ncbi:MAG: methyltransferase domain-containing protein [Candidatus Sphingomonas colombiensis]|nr:methyltransferase domain-containing protein [Sphingomonas sp.]WEK43518.1 MAG: methyltransferase domain-containing protein [Sphingomonas sp.]
MKVDGNRFRTKRFARFLALLDKLPAKDGPARILDIGGTREYWQALRPLWEGRKIDVTIVNLDQPTEDDDVFHLRSDNACALHYPDMAFDVVHSNSVIEHVGHWPEMAAMAREVRRLAPHYYLQTPNFWFPVEPHYRSLMFHWLPESYRAARLVNRRHGFRSASDYDEAMRNIQTVVLLTARQMGALFPDARIERERIGPLTKSLIAIR